MGVAAILTGAERYFAFDVVAHANVERNLKIAEDLIQLFAARVDIPGAAEFPEVGPTLEDYRFPDTLLTQERMQRALDRRRLDRIMASLMNTASRESMIQYHAPWSTKGAVEHNSLDLVFSQATLEHVDNLPDVYRAMYGWLKPGAYMSHLIDFKCHDTALEWNGHWTYSDLMWKLVRGKDVCLINREPYSSHVALMKESGFNIVGEQFIKRPSKVTRHQLARQFRSIPDSDLETAGALVQAMKPGRFL